MKFTTVTTSKGQLTIPKPVRDKLKLGTGIKVDIYPTENGFIGQIHRKSRILDIIGSLKSLDKGEDLSAVRLKSQELAAKEIVKRLESK